MALQRCKAISYLGTWFSDECPDRPGEAIKTPLNDGSRKCYSEARSMTFRVSTLINVGLFGALLLVGSINPVLAGDGCGKDRKDTSSSDLSPSTIVADDRVG